MLTMSGLTVGWPDPEGDLGVAERKPVSDTAVHKLCDLRQRPVSLDLSLISPGG